MSEQKPLLLLDIDGVLNAFGQAAHIDSESSAPSQFKVAEAKGYMLFIHESVPESVAVLEEHFTVVWATMWQSDAHIFGRVAGFGTEWEFIDFYETNQHIANVGGGTFGGSGRGVGYYKWPGIVQFAGDRPFVWIDDDLEDWQHDWARNRTVDGVPTLFIQPNIFEGLTIDHVKQAIDFATTVT